MRLEAFKLQRTGNAKGKGLEMTGKPNGSRRATKRTAFAFAFVPLAACAPGVFDMQSRAVAASDAGATRRDVDGASAAGSTRDDVPADAVLWFAADRASADAGGAVLEWKNLGTGEHTARAADSDSAPKLVTIDGRSWLQLDGQAELILPVMPAISALSFFAVVNADRSADALRCPSLLHLANRESASVTQTARLEFGRHMAEFLYQIDAKEITNAKGSGSFPPQADHLVSVIHGSDRIVRLHVDTQAIKEPVMLDLPPPVERGFNYIGHNHYYADATTPRCDAFHGRIAEIMLFDRGVTDQERARIERYLSRKWGLSFPR